MPSRFTVLHRRRGDVEVKSASDCIEAVAVLVEAATDSRLLARLHGETLESVAGWCDLMGRLGRPDSSSNSRFGGAPRRDLQEGNCRKGKANTPSPSRMACSLLWAKGRP